MGIGVKGPIELREARYLFHGVITESRSGKDAILGEVCREQDHVVVMCTIFKCEEGSKYDQNMVLWLIIAYRTLNFNRS